MQDQYIEAFRYSILLDLCEGCQCFTSFWPVVHNLAMITSPPVPVGEVQAGDIGHTVDGSKPSWNEGMLDHRVAGVPVDPHSIEEAENIIESYLMQAWLAMLSFHDNTIGIGLQDA